MFRFPIRDRADSLTELPDVIRRADALDEAERAVALEAGFRLATGGNRTFGDAVDALESMDTTERRQLVNDARTSCGLETFEAVEADAKREAAMRALAPDPGLQACHAEGCSVFPTTSSGSWRPVDCRKWWCPAHSELAGPDDHLPPVPMYVFRPGTFGLRLNPDHPEAKRIKAEAEKEREERREREEQRQREAEAIRKVRGRYEREAVISLGNVRVHPDGRIVR